MTISAELLTHYFQAHYQVSYQGRSITFRVEEQNAELAQLLREQKANSALFVTAFNPYSQRLSDDENFTRNQMLELKLRHLNKRYFSGYGTGGENAADNRQHKWPKELSHLVLDIEKEEAQRWLHEFAQNAAVFIDNNGNCSLILNQLQR